MTEERLPYQVSLDNVRPLLSALQEAAPRPPEGASGGDKKNYAERLSRALATTVANGLRARFPGILPTATGEQQESTALTPTGAKRLDVNYSTPELGLGLGVSIKTTNYPDSGGRFTKNTSRFDDELLSEAIGYHRRQPYAILIAIFFMPIEACDDGSDRAPSSFGAWVQKLRHRAGRTDPQDPEELFERIFIGLYQWDEDHEGEARFFDVMNPPPRTRRPFDDETIGWDALMRSIISTYEERNDPPDVWAID